MKIVVMSDTHGDAQIISTIQKKEYNADHFFHCGDSELLYDDEHFKDTIRVRGNCDRDTNFKNEIIIEIDAYTIFITHGHLYNIKTTLTNLDYKAQEVGANIILFGHSHILGAESVQNKLYLNPGSLTLPRGGNPKSYATIEWSTGSEDVTVTFKTPDDRILSKHLFSILKK